MSRSGLTLHPMYWRSSPVLTITVIFSGGNTLARPSRKRAAPTPPARQVIARNTQRPARAFRPDETSSLTLFPFLSRFPDLFQMSGFQEVGGCSKVDIS